MGIKLDGRNIPQIYLGKNKLYDVPEIPEPEPGIVKDNLILHYDFSQGDNNAEDRGVIKDLSGNGNDGVLNNFDYSEESGYVENGLRFDGIDDYIEFNEIVLSPNQDFTIEAVVSDTQFDYQNYGYIISDGANFGKGLRIGTNSVYFKTGNDYYTFFSGRPIPNHIAYTYNEEKVTSRLNGVIDITSTTAPQENDFMIKQLSLPGNYYRYQGVIHSIRIYKRELSETELTNNYNIDNEKYFGIIPPPPTPKQYIPTGLKTGEKDISLIMRGDRVVYPNTVQDGLRLWYDFRSMAHDPLKEFRVKDLSGNGNDGSLANFKFDGSDGYIDKGLMFNGEGSEVNFPKITFASGEDWTVEIVTSGDYEKTFYIMGSKSSSSQIRLSNLTASNRIRLSYSIPGSSVGGFIPITHPLHTIVSIESMRLMARDASSYSDDRSDSFLLEEEFESVFDNLGNAYRNNNNYAYHGLIYAVRIYDRALTQEEVTQNYIIDKARYGL